MTVEYDLFGDPIVPPPVDTRSPGARATARRQRLAADGINPLVGAATPNHLVGNTCGGCAHRVIATAYSGKSYPKCNGWPDLATHSEASDVRTYWPACERWEEETNHA